MIARLWCGVQVQKRHLKAEEPEIVTEQIQVDPLLVARRVVAHQIDRKGAPKVFDVGNIHCVRWKVQSAVAHERTKLPACCSCTAETFSMR